MSRLPLMPGCELLPFDTVAGQCRACGADLTKAQRSWCGAPCKLMYESNHYWNAARHAAVKRDLGCVRCGWTADHSLEEITTCGQYVMWTRSMLTTNAPDNWLEVNHIVPRLGEGYPTGCIHHLAALETLCHKCHVKVTRHQRLARARSA